MLIEGIIQRSKEGVVHLMANRVHDRTAMLACLSENDDITPSMAHANEAGRLPQTGTRGHPRNVRILPRSRDFH
jgi:error-prone DNA polymerase